MLFSALFVVVVVLFVLPIVFAFFVDRVGGRVSLFVVYRSLGGRVFPGVRCLGIRGCVPRREANAMLARVVSGRVSPGVRC